MNELYLDTNILLDYYLDRKDGIRPLGEFAFRLLKESVGCRYSVLISDLTTEELRSALKISEKDVWREVLFSLKYARKIRLVQSSDKQYDEARRLSKEIGIHQKDMLHTIIARDNHASIVTRDKHFDIVRNLVNVYLPEELV